MSLFTPGRVDAEELLDQGGAPPAEVERSLRDLRRLNAYCGGARAYRLLLRRLVAPSDAPTHSILDLGTGTSDLVESLDSLMTGIGLDLRIEHLAYGARVGNPRTPRIAGDAKSIPLRDASVDVVTSSHFFHHFDVDTNVRILEESLRVARLGVMITDTRRHIAPLFFCRMLAWARLVGPITRTDAPASVLRGYTTEEAREVASRTSATRLEIISMIPYRFGVLLWK